MAIFHKPMLTDSFLRSLWHDEFLAYKAGTADSELESLLQDWARRRDLGESASEAPFIQIFFNGIWGYSGSGQAATGTFSYQQQFPIAGAGQDAGTGRADLALGFFTGDEASDIPQVLCEFKGLKGSLDTPQRRPGRAGGRSAVEQAKDYLWGARRGLYGNEDVVPEWAVVTNMREFRLYWFDRMPHEAMVFTLGGDLFDQERSLFASGEEGQFRRFVFSRVFHRDWLLGTRGASPLRLLIARQGVAQKKIEEDFYREYRALRERLYNALVTHNPEFPGTRGRLLRLAQRILDRLLFVLYCEDRGGVIGFPAQLLRDYLNDYSMSVVYEEATDDIWIVIRRLFRVMNSGGNFGPAKLQCFNGGLFKSDPEIESLFVPNYMFCKIYQGSNLASVERDKETVLYFADRYDFSSTGTGEGLDLYTLGHIFEQSITELEIREAELDDRPSVGKISKRKRDGVYYTPERVVQAIVAQTVGPRLEELQLEAGWQDGIAPSLAALDAYEAAVWKLRLLDPACGSGAFLVTALRYFVDEHLRIEAMRRERKARPRLDSTLKIMDRLLAECIYGVDINPSSVEIAKLALWLHSARKGEPLSSLDHTVQDGNSLISNRFYDHLQVYAEEERERVNTLDWATRFPEIFANGGFDFVVGNPPYVKLQNFRQVHADMADFLRHGRGGQSEYSSTQSGNFDLYLPFIEKGLDLLNPAGRMGYIAPSVWLVNEYGEALRRDMARSRCLDRWIDFKSFQIFEEATTYTALQFFTKRSNEAIRFINAPDGVLAKLNWDDAGRAVPYAGLKGTENWSLLPRDERAFVDRMEREHLRLDDARVTRGIFQGLITSADSIYHLRKLGPGVYQRQPNPAERLRGQVPYEVKLEDAIMHPLVSGVEAKRYIEPATETYILLPYDTSKAQLFDEDRLLKQYPLAWRYLQSWEKQLRWRENRKMDRPGWYGYVYPKNLDKQHLPKLVVPRLVEFLHGFDDSKGAFCLDNVDVGGVLPAAGVDSQFLLALLNCPISDFIFRRKSKPFRGEYRSANKQFIAHLPIPRPDHALAAEIAGQGQNLQTLHTRRRQILRDAQRRLNSLGREIKPADWLFPGLDNIGRAAGWERIRPLLARHGDMDVALQRGEISLKSQGRLVLDKVFVSEAEAPLVLAGWQFFWRSFSLSEKTSAKALDTKLRTIPLNSHAAASTQFVALMQQALVLEGAILLAEEETNALIYRALGLHDEERAMIEADRAPVFGVF